MATLRGTITIDIYDHDDGDGFRILTVSAPGLGRFKTEAFVRTVRLDGTDYEHIAGDVMDIAETLPDIPTWMLEVPEVTR